MYVCMYVCMYICINIKPALSRRAWPASLFSLETAANTTDCLLALLDSADDSIASMPTFFGATATDFDFATKNIRKILAITRNGRRMG